MKKLISLFLFLFLSVVVFGVTDWDRCVRNGVATETKMMLRTGEDSGTSKEISSGAAITIDSSFIIVDTESDGASDTLSTMNVGTETGRYSAVKNGDMVILRQELSSQDITLDETGNIDLGAYNTVVLGDIKDSVMLQYDSTNDLWLVLYHNADAGVSLNVQ